MKERLITEEEREELYNNGKGLDYPFITIKEKLLKGCGEDWTIPNPLKKEYDMEITCGEENLYCPTCQAKLQQHEETSKVYEERIEDLENMLQGRNERE